ncbi:hypothetical protein H4S06_001295 [Coemansia sp. BCRC 34490]|nr:hypothetical protein H4S06_001295 [Coemansia sp. BCRC 34490]
MADSSSSSSPDRHLRLAAHWAATAIAHAQEEMLSSIQHNVTQATVETERQFEHLESLDTAYHESQHIWDRESRQIQQSVTDSSCAQLDTLSELVDRLESDLTELENQIGRAESAMGLSLTGRIEQFARFLGSSAAAVSFRSLGSTAPPGSASTGTGAGASAAGVPYLRQWAAKDIAVPHVTRISDYFDDEDNDNKQ